MNWIKIIHLKNEEEVAINIKNMSYEEVVENIHNEIENDFTIEVESKSSIYVININEIAYMEVRCTNEEKLKD